VQTLPIDAILEDIVRTVFSDGALVLEAPPGAGKTTRVPPALLEALGDATGEQGDVVVLEPRRLAARMAAERVAEERGERVGETVGYTVRFEDQTSSATRIRFVTEGILTRRLVSDPELRGTAIVVLDEFHERHLHGDVALALVRRLRLTRRPDLRVVVMSATLSTKPVADYLGATTLRTEGRTFEVNIEHAKGADDRPLALQVAGAVRAAVRDEADGDVLVFLPGAAEIRRAREALESIALEHDLALLPLHGDLSPADQDRAIRRQLRRKVILATNVAESSVTIDGVVAVVDSGLARVKGHASWSGLPTLQVAKISRASAAQRAGRAGRTRPGRCMRLYTHADWALRPEHDTPEIQRVDLAQTWLELADAGATDLAWLDAPPEAATRAAVELLTRLGALEGRDQVTELGKRLLLFPLHPRQGRLLLEASQRGVARDGAVLAALLAERDIRRTQRARFHDRRDARDAATERSDLLAMLDLFREAEDARFADGALRRLELDPGPTLAVSRAVRQITSRQGKGPARTGWDATSAAPRRRDPDPKEVEDSLLLCVLAGYPDRVVKRGQGRTLAMAGGGSAELSEESVVRDAPWMVATSADEYRGRALVRVASAIEPDWLLELFPHAVHEVTHTRWDASSESAVANSRLVYEGLVLVESETTGTTDEMARVLAAAALQAGARSFAPEGALDRWLARVRFAEEHDRDIAAPGDPEVEEALRAMCADKRTFAELRKASLLDALDARLDARGRARLAKLAPERVTLAGGRTLRVEYEAGRAPWIASRLQDFFGMAEGPRVAEGRVPLVLHLLAPNQRAQQVTTDLQGFWNKHYPSVRRELARKYPRHAWPEDPLRAAPPRSR
jgi:ATP-dependent helicase HrpB